MDTYDIKCRIIEEELRSVWPEWHVADHLGGGSFGDVFRIYRNNHGIREESALKVIQINDRMATMILPANAQDGSQPDIPESLFGEIQIMEALRGSPNIVNIEDFSYKREGQTSTLLVRMELLTSLQDVLPGRNGEGTLSSIGEIIKLCKDICTALMYCESKGIIHRDIKPANLFVDRFGNYKVGDFGASKRMETVHVAQTMTGIGTISYMAPEIFRGQSYNNTVDIYALGLVLYQRLNKGRIPFLPERGSYTTQDIDSANYQRLHGTPIPSLEGKYVAGERISKRLDAVVRKACAIDPADRYQTAKEFYDALVHVEKSEKKSDRSKSAFIAIALTCIIAAAALIILSTRQGGNGSSAGTEQAIVADTEGSGSEEGSTVGISGADTQVEGTVTGGNTSEEGSTVDDSGSGTEVAGTITEEETVHGTISDSWEEIIAAGEDGTYSEKYQIGDTKELDLGEEGVIEMELVAFDTDELADGSGKAHMTWIAKNLLNTEYAMNEEKKSKSGWSESDMRAWLQDSILPLFPDEVRSNIKEVKKYSCSYYYGTISSTDTIWIPSRREIFGADYYYEDNGPEYLTAYPDNDSRTKYRSGELSWYWLRTAYEFNDYTFMYVHYSGSHSWHGYGGNKGGVAVGFCL